MHIDKPIQVIELALARAQKERQMRSVSVVIGVVAGGSHRVTAASLEPGAEPESMWIIRRA